ncbi:MAG: pilus assembly protein TadB [Robiginitomaculum sp.]|nr:MAG: pilus assembly protein TadB [Robiginitomaculum sp.]
MNSDIVYVLIFGSGFLAVQAIFGLVRSARSSRVVNQRLRVEARVGSGTEALQIMRKSRGLNESGDFAMALHWFNTLVTRSGLPFRATEWAIIAAVLFLAGAVGAFLMTHSLIMALLFSLFTGLILPLFYLKHRAAKRSKQISSQLTNALEIIVRSLSAGHPVPSAVALVGREMPDPIGSEFGIVSYEISYGSSLSQAVGRLSERAGNSDIDLFAATVRLQERTGGNLAELLSVIAATVRERQKMRLKINAASSEGRASAMILTSAPFIVAGVLQVMSPSFYGDVIHERAIHIGLAGLLGWMILGNLVMRKMINFKI